MIEFIINRPFLFRYEHTRYSYLTDSNKHYRLHKFHDGYKPVFLPYNYKRVFISGFLHTITKEVIIYKISVINERIDYREKLERYLFENPDPFHYDKKAEKDALAFLKTYKGLR